MDRYSKMQMFQIYSRDVSSLTAIRVMRALTIMCPIVIALRFYIVS